jgi:hypothetical protein
VGNQKRKNIASVRMQYFPCPLAQSAVKYSFKDVRAIVPPSRRQLLQYILRTDTCNKIFYCPQGDNGPFGIGQGSDLLIHK